MGECKGQSHTLSVSAIILDLYEPKNFYGGQHEYGTAKQSRQPLVKSTQDLLENATLGKLAAGIVHEIKNPMTTVIGFLTLSKRSPSVFEKYVDVMLDEIGEAFYSTKDAGIGLGVKNCRRVITAHQGDIWMESGHQKGTVVFVRLPKYGGTVPERDAMNMAQHEKEIRCVL
ncbi:MAG: ATP-binding protein [Firmicutes bacterium]|nr:ATP-binding protein [Bacillota bacterium]